MSAARWLSVGIGCIVLSQIAALAAYGARPSANLEIGLTPDELAAEQAEQTLGQVFRDLEPGEFAGTLMLGGLRGLVTDLVWMRAVDAKETKQYYESVALFGMISRLQPRFSKVWEFGSHDMAYNIAHEAESREDKYAWFLAGLEFNRQGVLRNPLDELILRHLAWMFYHKGETLMQEVESTSWAAFANPILRRFDDPGIGTGRGILNPGNNDDGSPGDFWILEGALNGGMLQLGGYVLVKFQGVDLGAATVSELNQDGSFTALLPLTDLTEDQRSFLTAGLDVELAEQVGNYDLASRLYRGCIELDERVDSRRSPYVRRFVGISLMNDGNRLRNRGQHLAALRQYLHALEEWQDILAYGKDPKNGYTPAEIKVNQASYRRNDGRLRRQCAVLGQALAPSVEIADAFGAAVRQRNFEQAHQLLDEPGWQMAVHSLGSIRWLDDVAVQN